MDRREERGKGEVRATTYPFHRRGVERRKKERRVVERGKRGRGGPLRTHLISEDGVAFLAPVEEHPSHALPLVVPQL